MISLKSEYGQSICIIHRQFDYSPAENTKSITYAFSHLYIYTNLAFVVFPTQFLSKILEQPRIHFIDNNLSRYEMAIIDKRSAVARLILDTAAGANCTSGH